MDENIIGANYTYSTIRDDLFRNLMVLHDKSQPSINFDWNDEYDVLTFREYVVEACHYAPPILLFIDMIFNKIKLPFR